MSGNLANMSDRDKKNQDGQAPLPAPPPRRFTLSEAVGRAAGDALKGASPVAATRQALAELRNMLEIHLDDPEGSLRRTILARLENDPPLLATHVKAPAAALAVFLKRILDNEENLFSLVRDADARWGRDYDEKPRFETSDGITAPDDPYTRAGVRTLLVRLLGQLKT